MKQEGKSKEEKLTELFSSHVKHEDYFCVTQLYKKLELTPFFLICQKKDKWQTMSFVSIMGNLAFNSLLKTFRYPVLI